jgi:hypothetical protein
MTNWVVRGLTPSITRALRTEASRRLEPTVSSPQAAAPGKQRLRPSLDTHVIMRRGMSDALVMIDSNDGARDNQPGVSQETGDWKGIGIGSANRRAN